MNPVPMRDTIVPTPNNAGDQPVATRVLRGLLAKAPVNPINSMIAPRRLTPKPTTKPAKSAAVSRASMDWLTCCEPSKTLISGQFE